MAQQKGGNFYSFETFIHSLFSDRCYYVLWAGLFIYCSNIFIKVRMTNSHILLLTWIWYKSSSLNLDGLYGSTFLRLKHEIYF